MPLISPSEVLIDLYDAANPDPEKGPSEPRCVRPLLSAHCGRTLTSAHIASRSAVSKVMGEVLGFFKGLQRL